MVVGLNLLADSPNYNIYYLLCHFEDFHFLALQIKCEANLKKDMLLSIPMHVFFARSR
jgi:hypothetical protein